MTRKKPQGIADLRFVVAATQCDHGAIKPAAKLTRAQLLDWVRQQVAAGHEVHTVYEACGFGCTLHEALVAAGAQSLVTTPTRLSPERRRKNDRLDARELCVRLARHLAGHAHELQPIRIPARAEQARRELRRLESGGLGGFDSFAVRTADSASVGTPFNAVTTDDSPCATPFPPYCTVVWVVRIK